MDFSLLGFGVLKFRFGGIVLFSRAKDIFNKLESPEAPSLCPKFVFTSRIISTSSVFHGNLGGSQVTDPMYTPWSPKTLATASASMGSPTWDNFSLSVKWSHCKYENYKTQ